MIFYSVGIRTVRTVFEFFLNIRTNTNIFFLKIRIFFYSNTEFDFFFTNSILFERISNLFEYFRIFKKKFKKEELNKKNG
jgi:hypothetical protein